MNTSLPALVSTEWLARNLDAPGLAVLDASHHLPAAQRDAAAEYAAGHIPGARFLGLASLFDSGSPVPYALPTPDQLAARLALLGVRGEDAIILYDDSAIRTAARAWFMLTAMGWERVAILDGGLAKWRADHRPLEIGAGTSDPASPVQLTGPRRVRSKADMLANLDADREQVVDARSADRVYGTGTDPVHGLPMGRIPGALNLPFTELFNPDGTYRSTEEIRSAFENAGLDMTRPIVASCGSGVTASVLLFALHLIGESDFALYDGSWSEWGADPDTPKAQGPEIGRPDA
ncbi:3-mercaptopyruvate sulfurtransferase [Porphyrobacter sp. HT-58-2]|uniref:3-mercaptopyruvate sulfurtransferase n=1 Tax=Porphyrobacter sp. HT-58-2 TaxID=2023229 RepID=UPI000CDCC7A7|nr:3-mercaptopyruvate sulfurtransferase [Porphyrobacter sp. HT-58-2]AUX69306.1 3-mercaptopyruvate sulfurtransferase [Porphyrobacter sp. HT-58-2]